MGDSGISDIWMSDNNTWQVNASDIAWTSEYI